MNARERRDLDNHITGHYGEDQFADEPDDCPPAYYRPKTYYCTVCHKNPVDALDGYDTCDSCLRRQ